MNKGELVDVIAEKASVTKKEAEIVLSATLDIIVEAVTSGDKVTWWALSALRNASEKSEKGIIRKRARR